MRSNAKYCEMEALVEKTGVGLVGLNEVLSEKPPNSLERY